MRRHLAAAIMILSAIGCSGNDAESGEFVAGATMMDSAGIAVVENRTPLWNDGEGWKIAPAPTFSLGDSAATDGYPYVRGAKRLSNGDVLIAGESTVRRFDSTGKLVGTIGSKGEGPGEVRSLRQLMVLPGDTILLGGYSNRSKLSYFAPDGRFIRDQFVGRQKLSSLGRWIECLQLWLPDGSLLGCQQDPTIPVTATNRPSKMIKPGWTSPGPGYLRQLHRLYRIGPELDSTWKLGITTGIQQFGVEMPDGSEEFFVHPFYAQSVVTFGGRPLMIVMANSPRWEVEEWTLEGRLKRIIRVRGIRRVPTAEESKWAMGQMRERALRHALDTSAVEAALAKVPVPDSLPAIGTATVSNANDLAVLRSGVWGFKAPTTYDFFRADGRWLGSRELPPKWRLLDIGRDYLLGVRYDADDLPYVELYRLDRSGG